MWKWLKFILDLLGLYRTDIQQPQEQEAQTTADRIRTRNQEINSETEQAKRRVADLSSPALDDAIDRLRRRDPTPDCDRS